VRYVRSAEYAIFNPTWPMLAPGEAPAQCLSGFRYLELFGIWCLEFWISFTAGREHKKGTEIACTLGRQEGCMSGPRIYTEAWQRLKIAAKETECREPEEPKHITDSPEKPKRLRAPRPFFIATAVLAVLSTLTAAFWIDSQAKLMTAARNVTDFKTRLELVQENMKKVEDERQRLEDENSRLSVQYEERASELAQLEEELQSLKAQKARPKSEPKQPVARAETQPVKAASAPKTAQEPALSAPREKDSAQKPDTPGQRDVKSYTVD